MEGALLPENFCKVIDEISAMRREEVLVYLQNLAQKEGLLEEQQAELLEEYREHLQEEEEEIKNFARERPAYMEEELKVLEDF